MIIGITGKASSGKTTIANYIVKNYGFIKLSFATALKEMLLQAGMCDGEELYVTKTPTSRWLMQKIGTDIFRNQIDQNYWIKKLCWIMDKTKYTNYVIDDVRFPGEAEAISVRDGRLIKVICPNSPLNIIRADLEKHISELSIKSLQCDYVMMADYGDFENLYKFVDDYMKITWIQKRGEYYA